MRGPGVAASSWQFSTKATLQPTRRLHPQTSHRCPKWSLRTNPGSTAGVFWGASLGWARGTRWVSFPRGMTLVVLASPPLLPTESSEEPKKAFQRRPTIDSISSKELIHLAAISRWATQTDGGLRLWSVRVRWPSRAFPLNRGLVFDCVATGLAPVQHGGA